MSNRKELNSNELETVAGGVSIDNMWGNCDTYRLGRTNGKFIYQFPASKLGRVIEIANSIDTTGLSQSQVDDLLMPLLEAEPGLLEPYTGA